MNSRTLLLALLLALLLPAFSSASVFTITVFTDTTGTPSGGGAGVAGDLRNAMLAANPGDTIRFTCGAPPCTITLNGPLPPITKNLTIDGGTFGNVIIDGNGLYRVFFVDSGTVTIANLQIQNALAQGGNGGNGAGPGGGGAGFGAGLFVNQATASVAVQSVLFKNMSVVGGAGGNATNTNDLPGYSGGGGGGLGFAGGAGDATGGSGGGGGGGGVTGAGGAFSGFVGGAGGSGGGGGGGSNGNVGNAAGGSGYAGNSAGGAGASNAAANGGFGGGGGGADCIGTAGAGGFGGGGGGGGSCVDTAGGNGGFGGGGGGSSSSGAGATSAAAVGGIHGGAAGPGDNLQNAGGGGGGAAAGTAVFVNAGSLTTLNSTSGGALSSTIGLGGAPAPGGTAGSNGTGNPNPVFNYAGTVNGSNATGASLAPLPFGVMPATHFSVVAVTPVTSYVTNGGGITVTALDATGATATGYNGVVHLTSTDPGFVNGTGDIQLTNGVGSFNNAQKQAGIQTVTATDTVLSNITGTSNSITVNPGAALGFTVSAPAAATAGTAFSLTVTATDLYGNTATGYAGTVHFTSTDGAAVLPANSSLTNGVGVFSATLNTPGNQTITATDTVTGSINGTSGTIATTLRAPTVSLSFNPTTVQVGGSSSSTMTFTLTNPNAIAITGLALSDAFPPNLVADAYPTNTCGASMNGVSFSISGFTLAANSSCQVVAAVHAAAITVFTNTTSTATSTNAATSGTASAMLTANAAVAPTLSEAFGTGAIAQGTSTSVTFTVTNPNNTIAVSAIVFTDTLPAGLVVSTPNGLANTCGGVVTALAGSGTIILTGGTLVASNSCSLMVSVTATATGTLVNTTSAVGSSVGAGGTAAATLTVGAVVDQTVTFNPLMPHGYGDAPFTVSASASSGLPVTFAALQNGVCTVTANNPATVTVLAAGFCQITGQQVGSTYVNSASATVSFNFRKAPLVVTATNAAMPAGGPLPVFSASYQGFVNGDTTTSITGVPNLATTATVNSPAGTYPITVSAGTMVSQNYSFFFVPGTLTVTGGGGNLPGLVNSASLTVGAIAPNTLLTLFNPSVGCSNAAVSIDSTMAQVLFAGATQINFMVPGTVANEATANLQILCGGNAVQTVQAPVAAVNPGIFTQTGSGSGQASVVNQDGTINSASHPAPRSSYVAFYTTGFGAYNPAGADGLQHTANPVTASIGGVTAPVVFAGYAPTEVTGLQQVNIQVPAGVTPGPAVPVILTVGGMSTATGVTIAVQ